MHNRVIDNRFELTERLGGGGMGLVWRAWDTALHREVALKEVRPPDPSFEEHDPEAARALRARVLREARALARLNHPHVATIHHIVDPGGDGYPWIVMELVTGGSLQDRLARGPMTPWETARLGREVLSALRAAHAVGIQHRDVKPANVLLREDGRSVLTDFGIAAVRESTSLTATGSFIGSPEYMAPERINGHEGDPASDLWSLGMLLYVAVEGRHPLRRSTTLATLAAVLNQEVPPPERAGPLGPVLGALLRRDPAGRPDAETLDRMLAAAADPGSAPPAYLPPAPAPAPLHPGHPSAPSAPLHPGHPSAPSGPLHQAGPLHHGPPQGATVPPGARQGATVPPGAPHPWGPQPSFSQPGTVASRRARRSPVAAVTASVGALAVTGVLVYTLLPGVRGAEEPTQPNTPQITPVETTDAQEPEASKEPEPQPENLLTPDGIRAAIKALKPVMGGTKVVRMVVYPTYISAEAPLKGDPAVYDRYAYRDGKATREGTGSTVRTPPVDLAKYNWDALPGLLKKAESVLGVRKPTTRYLIVDPNFVFTSTKQVLLVYLGDAYRTGYLVADPQGRVLKTYPAS
ncbi:protein kinase [Nonomuraea sp. NPDC005692]|uniref:serine/threonine-protein kinase n=1 Tax=Nonomuraea sp. NPDC005692 TaxID=3157168 RepID=UPI0033E72279